jgi:predicted aldo/keto reductase-like oxidoreductase
MVDSGMIEMLMYPINMFRDADDANKALYQACEDQGVGLVAMKPYAGGGIFIKTPPISPMQCIGYVLSQPIATTVIGVKNADELRAATHYWEAGEEEKDYKVILENIRHYLVGNCVYCNHCLPCPENINIGLMIHVADTYQYFPQDEIQAEYESLSVKASDCIECGDCIERCPFDVDIIAKMRQVVEYLEAVAK